MAKNKLDPKDDYQAEDDANTLMRHQQIINDPDRHERAHSKLQEKMQAHKAAYSSSRRQLQKKTKKRLKDVFGQGPTFQQEADKEKAEAESTVNEKD